MDCSTEFDIQINATGNITCKRADTFSLQLLMNYADDLSAYDLSAYDKIEMHIKISAKDAEYILAFTTEDATMTIVGTNQINLSQTADTMDVEAKPYVYDMQGTMGDVITTLSAGSFTITEDVTRETDIPTP